MIKILKETNFFQHQTYRDEPYKQLLNNPYPYVKVNVCITYAHNIVKINTCNQTTACYRVDHPSLEFWLSLSEGKAYAFIRKA